MSNAANFGAELRRSRLAAGLSLAELASRVHFSKGYLSKVENGIAPPNRALATLCDSALDIAGGLSALIPDDALRRQPRERISHPVGLPAATRHFTGRSAELAEICTALAGTPAVDRPAVGVCVVDGMAGVGKTALVVQAAHRLDGHFDGCLFLDLRGYRSDAEPESAGSALDRLLGLLGVNADNIPAAVDDRAAHYRDVLRGRRLLIVLDNVHRTDQVRPLLPAQSRCRVLITSRNRLNAMDDAHHVSLGLLPPDEAVALFRSVAGSGRVEAEGVDQDLLGSVVRRCGRLPLAIRIAAARYRGRPAWTLDHLNDRLAGERGRLEELDDGERSVAATFQLSHQGLPADQQRMFALLAVHPGGDFDSVAAAALAGVDHGDAVQGLDRLLDAHLLDQQVIGRYRFHDLVRGFAAQRALAEVPAEAPDSGWDAALDRLLDYYLYSADLADRLVTTHRYRVPLSVDQVPAAVPPVTDRDSALRWLSTELPNLVAACRAAAEHGRHDKCWQLAFTLRGVFFLVKAWDGWLETHQLAVRSARTIGHRQAEATTLNNLGLVLLERGDVDAASANYRRALSLFQEIGDEHGATAALANQAWVHRHRGDHQRALHDLESAYRAYLRAGARRNSAITLRGMGAIKAESGALEAAVQDVSGALQSFNELGLDIDAVMALNGLGEIRCRMGELETAAELHRQAILLAGACGSRYEQARAEAGLGGIAADAGRPDDARRHWTEALRLYGELGAPQTAQVRARLAALNAGPAR